MERERERESKVILSYMHTTNLNLIVTQEERAKGKRRKNSPILAARTNLIDQKFFGYDNLRSFDFILTPIRSCTFSSSCPSFSSLQE